MEENLPNDRLEEFIRESFKDHEADPGATLWNRIDQSLGGTPVAPTGVNIKLWGMSVAATIAVIVISYLVWNNVNLNKQLKKIKEETARLDQHTDGNDTAAKDDQSENNTYLLDGLVPELKQAENIVGQQESLQNNSTESPNDNSLEKNNISISKEKSLITEEELVASQPSVEFNKARKPLDQKVEGLADRTNTDPKIKQSSDKSRKTTDSPLYTQKIISPGKNNSKQEAMKPLVNDRSDNFDLSKINKINKSLNPDQPIGNLPIEPDPSGKLNISGDPKSGENSVAKIPVRDEVASAHPLRTLFPATITSVTNSNKLIEVNTNTLITSSVPAIPRSLVLNISGGTISETGSLQLPSPPPGHGIPPSDNAYHTVRSLQAAIGISKYFTKDFQFQTGIIVKQYQVINEINQNFLFGDRLRKPGGPAFEHDFGYKIHAPGGTAEIEIASEQLDPRATIDDTEKINFKISNSTEFKYLTFPLAINFNKSFGKWGIFAGTGLHADLLLKQEAETKVEVISSKLKLKKEIESPKFNKSSSLVLNGVLSAGVQYRLTRQISIQLSPSLYLPLTHRNKDFDTLYHTKSFGFQLGINYDLAAL